MEVLADNGLPLAPANGHLDLSDAERNTIRHDVELAVQHLLSSLRIDWRNDHNTQGTPGRVARMFVDEVMRGRFHPAPSLTDFPNAANLDQLYVVGPITVRSMCSHHLVPILGRAWVGVIPSDRVIGLSKFTRLTEWVMARPQIQEEAAIQLADVIEEAIRPKGLGLVIRAQHLCMTWRGVRDNGTEMTTSVMRGILLEDAAARAEFLRMI